MPLTEDQWQSLVLKECEGNESVIEEWDSLWERTKDFDLADPSGELRFRALVVAGLQLVLADAAADVATNEGGGQGGQWQEHFDHVKILLDRADKQYQVQAKTAIAAGTSIAAMNTYSLTPPDPGQPAPGSPGYLGDPRYRRVDSPGRLGW